MELSLSTAVFRSILEPNSELPLVLRMVSYYDFVPLPRGGDDATNRCKSFETECKQSALTVWRFHPHTPIELHRPRPFIWSFHRQYGRRELAPRFPSAKARVCLRLIGFRGTLTINIV